MGLVDHAKRELAILDEGNPDEMQMEMNRHIIEMVELFANEGHSGFSASYAIQILEKLLRLEPITPLTGNDDEWHQPIDGDPMKQNVRCSRVFKDADGSAYDCEGIVFRHPDGSCYLSSGSSVPVTFPYVPQKRYVDVDDNGEPLTKA